MSIRVTLLTLIVIFLSGYAFKNWFNALIGAIVLFAFLEHPDMPRSIGGVPGFNLWNVLFLCITFAWLSQRTAEGNEWDFPKGVLIALWLYLAVMTTAFLRALIDPTLFYGGTRMDILIDYFINPIKYLLPALMLYDGCRSRQRVVVAIGAILFVYLMLALQTIRVMGFNFNFSSGAEFSDQAGFRLTRRVGYHRVDMSMMLAGASWAIIAYSRYFRQLPVKLMLFGTAGVVLIGQAVTGGRMGYVTWGLVGLTLCVVKWRKLLPLIPAVIAGILIWMPAVRDRMLEGFAQNEGGIVSETDSSEITSGRSEIWPLVIDMIGESPVIGYGRIAMQRIGLRAELGDFNHPHNAYLEYMLDNGVIGFLCGMPIFMLLFWRCFSLFRDRDDLLYEVIGGVALSLLLALMIAAMGAQTFYPREGTVGMWAALGIALRAWVQRNESLPGQPAFAGAPAEWVVDTDEYEGQPIRESGRHIDTN